MWEFLNFLRVSEQIASNPNLALAGRISGKRDKKYEIANCKLHTSQNCTQRKSHKTSYTPPLFISFRSRNLRYTAGTHFWVLMGPQNPERRVFELFHDIFGSVEGSNTPENDPEQVREKFRRQLVFRKHFFLGQFWGPLWVILAGPNWPKNGEENPGDDDCGLFLGCHKCLSSN